MPADSDNPRRLPCLILQRSGIPSVVWFEDAVREYGVPTALFDLYVLVPEMKAAAQCLELHGWTSIPQESGVFGNAKVSLAEQPQWCLQPPSESNGPGDPYPLRFEGLYEYDYVRLLPTANWNFTFHEQMSSFVPSLENLVDSLMDCQMDLPDGKELQDHVSVQLAYLFGHVPELQEKGFTERLHYEHRQYHLDILAGMSWSGIPFISHERGIRQRLRERTYELQECSASRDNELLFNNAMQARLLAAMPPPPE